LWCFFFLEWWCFFLWCFFFLWWTFLDFFFLLDFFFFELTFLLLCCMTRAREASPNTICAGNMTTQGRTKVALLGCNRAAHCSNMCGDDCCSALLQHSSKRALCVASTRWTPHQTTHQSKRSNKSLNRCMHTFSSFLTSFCSFLIFLSSFSRCFSHLASLLWCFFGFLWPSSAPQQSAHQHVVAGADLAATVPPCVPAVHTAQQSSQCAHRARKRTTDRSMQAE
jgi:hypothetical protein